MNNYLEQFSEERLIELAEMCESKALGFPASHAESAALARIALAAKQDKPKFEEWMSTQSEKIEVDCGCVTTEAFYHWLKVAYEATPQPAHTEQDGWRLVPIEPTQEMVDAHISGMQSAGFIRAYRDMLAATPKLDGTLISEGTKYDSCQWNPDEDSVYSTGCGNEWQFTDGGLEDNQIKFCPYCSGKIAAPKPESE